MEPLKPYRPTVLNQVATWFIFACVFMFSWDGALSKGMGMLNDDADAAFVATSVRTLRRPYLIALSLYTVVYAWFNIVFVMLLLYSASALLWMTAPLCKEPWERFVRIAFPSTLLFNCMDTAHAPFHLAVAAGIVFCGSITVGFYMDDADLLLKHHVRSKGARALFIAPAVMCIAYALYALFCILIAPSYTPAVSA